MSVDRNNLVKLWNVMTGRLLRKIEHNGVIGCCEWGIDSSQVLLAYQNI